MFELRENKINGCPEDNQVTISGCPSKDLVVRTWSKINGVEFHTWGMKIDGCPSDNHISIFGCPTTFLVVPGARTTKISNADYRYTKRRKC